MLYKEIIDKQNKRLQTISLTKKLFAKFKQ